MPGARCATKNFFCLSYISPKVYLRSEMIVSRDAQDHKIYMHTLLWGITVVPLF